MDGLLQVLLSTFSALINYTAWSFNLFTASLYVIKHLFTRKISIVFLKWSTTLFHWYIAKVRALLNFTNLLGSYARQPWEVFILILALLIICLPSCFVKNGFRFWRTCCFLNGACFSVTLWIFWLVYHKRGGLHINFLVKKLFLDQSKTVEHLMQRLINIRALWYQAKPLKQQK